MSLFFESLKPTQTERTIRKWRDHAHEMRQILEGKEGDCRNIRNESRKMRYETTVAKNWENYLNSTKLHDRAYEIKVLVLYAENILPRIAKEKVLVDEERFETETLMQKCDTWLAICVKGLNCLDKKLEDEITRDDEAYIQIKQEIALLENAKRNLKEDCLLAWETSNKLEDIETKIKLNLEFKQEVLAIEERCMRIEKMDTGVSFKVDPTKGPDKMLSLEEWSKAVHDLVEKGLCEIECSRKLRERMFKTRGVSLNDYTTQFDKTDYEMRKRIYDINREKNENQYQSMKVKELMEVTKAEWLRLEEYLKEVKNDLRCAETRCTDRYFRPSIEATVDAPFTGLNKEVVQLTSMAETVESHIEIHKAFYNKLEEDAHKLFLESESKNKSLRVQIQALDIRLAERCDPKKIYAYNPDFLLSKMVTQLPPLYSLYSSKLW